MESYALLLGATLSAGTVLALAALGLSDGQCSASRLAAPVPEAAAVSAALAEAHRQAERLTATQAERDAARKEASQAREDAATLRGRVEALETVMAQEKGKTGGAKKT